MKNSRPDIAALFEDESKKDDIKVPNVDPSTTIMYHWEKVARRMMQNLMKHPKAMMLFNEPVDAIKLNIPDYHQIITQPMDFGTIDRNLRSHKYVSMKKFLEDVELVFNNAYNYNGQESSVSVMTREVETEYNNLCNQLNAGFYLTDADN